MGWEAIEQYLTEVEKEATNIVDQQVPQMIIEDTSMMLTSTDTQIPDFLSDDIPFSGPAPTYVPGTSESPVQREEEVSEYYDLDQDSRSFYPKEDIYHSTEKHCTEFNIGFRNNSEIQCQIKQEQLDDYFPNQCNNGNYFIQEQEQAYLTMASKVLTECTEDVQNTCKCLQIAQDPVYWSEQNVQDWVTWQCRQYNEQLPNLDFFFVNGSQLCRWTLNEFTLYAPEAGQMLYSRLDIWRSVVEQTTSRGWSQCMPEVTQIPVPTSPSLPMSSPSPERLSPSPSSWSDETMSDSPKIYLSGADQDKDRLPEEPVHHHRQTIQLWQFLKLLLVDPSGLYKDCIRWVDRARGIFKIENSSRVAKLWGKRKNRPAMNYDKLSRSIRQYYKKGIIKKTEQSKRLVYQFCKP